MTMSDGKKSVQVSIGFDSKRAFFNYSGLGNYSRNLLSALTKNHPGNTYILFTPGTKNRIILENEERFRIIEPASPLLKLFGPLWRSKYIVSDIKKQKPDIFHGLSQELPSGIEKAGVRSAVTVHDLIFIRFPEYYKWPDTKIYTRKLIHACKVSDRIVAISGQTRDDLVSFLDVPPGKISVIHQGCNPYFWDKSDDEFNAEIRKKYNLPARYLLSVSTIEERKNLLGIVKAIHVSGIGVPLVVIGRRSGDYFSKVMDYINVNKLKNIIFPGAILNTELPAIYRNAECFLYPSFFEGFGIPIVEALVSGVPVITSKGGCFPEAAGPGSIYVDPGKPEELGDAIQKVINDKELRKKMITAGTVYANNFKDDNVANAYMDLYHSMLT
jgi:glycosyltransferase involved in cell wall biosynthesis